MSARPRILLSTACCTTVLAISLSGADQQQSAAAAQRAIAYLSQEVPNWPQENNCFSCHNNGDAARALYVARALSHPVPPEALAGTTAWLLRPDDWNDEKGDPGFSDLKLARIQFAAALTEAIQTNAVQNREPLAAAAERLLEDQEENGSWDVDVPGVVGSPATYGDTLGTYMARRTLHAAGEARFREAIDRADAWFLTATSSATVDVAAVALALTDRLRGTPGSSAPTAATAAVQTKFRQVVEHLLGSQSSDGGWGPYPKSPSEPFDTAITLLALKGALDQQEGDQQAIREKIAKGRAHLVARQLPGGGWPETTRPSGFQSYAQHISTSGWATLALLKTMDVAE
jgi:hypothetical protein